MLDAKKIIDRINEAGIESQCHQLLNSCSLLPSLQLTRKPNYQFGFFVSKICSLAGTYFSGRPARVGQI